MKQPAMSFAVLAHIHFISEKQRTVNKVIEFLK